MNLLWRALSLLLSEAGVGRQTPSGAGAWRKGSDTDSNGQAHGSLLYRCRFPPMDLCGHQNTYRPTRAETHWHVLLAETQRWRHMNPDLYADTLRNPWAPTETHYTGRNTATHEHLNTDSPKVPWPHGLRHVHWHSETWACPHILMNADKLRDPASEQKGPGRHRQHAP